MCSGVFAAESVDFRQFAGFASPKDTNERFHFLMNHGETGLSTAFDLPTLMGYDSDHPMSFGEVGVCGVASVTFTFLNEKYLKSVLHCEHSVSPNLILV